jgi:hypothetical protein
MQKSEMFGNFLNPVEPEMCGECLADLKVEINELVWKYLPSSTTLEVADELACYIFDLIASPADAHVKVQVA